ncbi:hypothetical protein CK203_074163 [Vitis vinifera]|uniref:Uncharacterized protein n=1 Tax=Vitis vinifera TaxID=29760 RepID=A0A438DU49_VITVI|nr:hypothetical protein CK203_074163 [Vitis vinifera]
MDEVNLNGTTNGGNSSSDDEVVVGEDEELAESKDSINGTSSSNIDFLNGFNSSMNGVINTQNEKPSASGDLSFFQFETTDNDDLFGDRPLPEWVGWGESADLQVGGSSLNPFEDENGDTNVTHPTPAEEAVLNVNSSSHGELVLPNGSPTATGSEGSAGSGSSQRGATVPSLFEEDVEFVGPLKRNIIAKVPEKENSDDGGAGMKEFNDANYWRVDTETFNLRAFGISFDKLGCIDSQQKVVLVNLQSESDGLDCLEFKQSMGYHYTNPPASLGLAISCCIGKQWLKMTEVVLNDRLGGEGASEVQRGRHNRRYEEAGAWWLLSREPGPTRLGFRIDTPFLRITSLSRTRRFMMAWASNSLQLVSSLSPPLKP